MHMHVDIYHVNFLWQTNQSLWLKKFVFMIAYLLIYISLIYDWLLTFACVGGVEGYCNRSVCLSVCQHSSRKPTNISTLKILLADVKSCKDQKEQQAFAKTFLF